jgi:hypothetical protein
VKHHLSKLSNLHKSEALRRSRFSKVNLALFAVIFAGIGGYLIFRSFAASANVFVATTGNDATCVRGDSTKPCKTLNKAYQIAQSGDTVEVAAGNYTGMQTLLADASKTSMVTFQPAQGANVSFDEVYFGVNQGAAGASWVTLKDFSVPQDVAMFTAQHITLDGINGGSVYVRGTQHVLVQNSDLGPCQSSGPNVCQSNNKVDTPLQGETEANDITFKNNIIHDSTITNVNDHFECFFIRGGNNLTFDWNKFYNCWTYDLMFQSLTPITMTLQNNWFGLTSQFGGGSRQSAICYCGGQVGSVMMRYNSFAPGESFVTENGNPPGTVTAIGNIFGSSGSRPDYDCPGNVTFDYNVWLGGSSCGTHAVNAGANLPYINSANVGPNWDYHLSGSGGTVADNLVTPTTANYVVSTDIDGDTRSAPRDAGADERTNPCTTTVSSASALTSAVSAAAGGDKICVSAGSYAAMTWTGGGSRTNRAIVQPVAGATVNFTGQLTIRSSHVEVKDISLAGQTYFIDGPVQDVKMTNITAKNFEIWSESGGGAQDITIQGGSLGPNHNYPDNRIASNGTTNVNRNIVIDGVDIHDQTRSDPNDHFECLQVWSADGLTVRNSKFTNCSVFSIFIQRLDPSAGTQPPTPTNILIENNFFDCCTDFIGGTASSYKNFAIMLPNSHGEGSWSNVTIRNNTANDRLDFDTSGITYNNVVVQNNIFSQLYYNTSGSSGTVAGINNDYNLWYGQNNKIGTHDLVNIAPTTLFTDFNNLNFHLKSGSAAIDAGNPSIYSPNDIDGDGRPAGAAPDIGADEFGGATSPPTPPPTPPPPTPPPTPPPSGTVLLGSNTLQGTSDFDPANTAEAFRYTATANGSTGTLAFYVDSGNAATSIKVGIYSDNAGQPGTLLTSGTIASPLIGSWNSATLSPAINITSGTTYWIGQLGIGGDLHYRDLATGNCSVSGSGTGLSALPATWTTGNSWPSCTVSAFVLAGSTGPKTGDINGDNSIDITDLSLLLSSYGQNTTQCITNNAFKCDLSSPGDGIVNIFDLSTLLSNYGK